jgi:hypothetical protein
MEVPQLPPVNANDTKTTSEIAVAVAATLLVAVTVFLRYLGRWVLQKRVEAGKARSGQTVYGLDDGKVKVGRRHCLGNQLTSSQFSTYFQWRLLLGLLSPP